ncbi:amidohydrolase [Neobacillus sp. LXY-1]|uniref:amidohydrolase n=1 Tax=Neobacillus sp. LXY-1 TaxID=3379133 RepID=UPI003EE0FE6C
MISFLRNQKLLAWLGIIVLLLPLLNGCAKEKEASPKKQAGGSDELATLVLKNGIVHTMEDNQPTAEAIAAKDGKIIFVGSSKDVENYVGKGTKVIDLKGKMVSPGLMDGHTHIPGLWTTKLFEVDLSGLKTHEEYLKAVADFRKKHPDVKIITGTGWKNGPYKQADGTNPGPKKEDLDAIVADIPVILYSIDNHSVWVNSKTMDMSKISKDTQAPKGGMIEHNPDGSPRGVLREGARDLVDQVQALFTLTKDQYKEAVLKYQEEMHSFGMTGIMTFQRTDDKMIDILGELEKEGKLTMRVSGTYFIDPGSNPEVEVEKMKKAQQKYHSDWLQVHTVKLFADGVTEGKTALFLEPYTEGAGMGRDFHGDSVWKIDNFNQMVSAMDKAGIQVHIHAIGDGAVNMSLNAIESAVKTNGERDARHTITHISAIKDSDIARMKALKVIASLQPFWFYKDQYYQLESAMIGQDRALAMYPARKIWDEGVLISGSSDYPPTPDYRPLNSIETGVTRNSPYPEEQDQDMVRNASQALTVQEMLQAVTKNVAYQIFRENDLGTLKVGKKADMVVLDQDITKINPKDISETPVDYTIVDGKIVYKK